MSFFRGVLRKVNLGLVRREIFFWLGLGLFLYGGGLILDLVVFLHLESWQNPWLDKGVFFLTEVALYAAVACLIAVMAYRIWHNVDHHTKLVPAFFGLVTTGIVAYILKALFDRPRPYEVLDLEPLVSSLGSSFPSAHTATAFALLIPFWRASKVVALFWGIFALLIGLARVYEGVHFPSDIAGGIFLGGAIGALFSHPEIKKMIVILWKQLEFRRQSFHFCTGFLCVFLHWSGFLPSWLIVFGLVLGLCISLVSQYCPIPFISNLLHLFDRPRDKHFPGRGAFYFLLGVFLTLQLFPLPIAYAAILILSVGDSLNHLITKGFKTIKLPWNRTKNLWGIGLGVLFGTLAAQFFVPVWPAFLACSVALAAETVPLRVGKFYIDDNLIVPLVTGLVLLLMV